MANFSPSLMSMPRIGAYTTEGLPVEKFAVAAGHAGPELIDFYRVFGQGTICGELWLDLNFRPIDFSEWFDWQDVDVSSLSGIRLVITSSWGVYVGVFTPVGLSSKYAMINANDVCWTVHESFTEAIGALSEEAGRPNLLRFPYYVTCQSFEKNAKLRVNPAFADSFVEVCRENFPDWLVFQERSYLGVHSRFVPPSRKFVGVINTSATLSNASATSYHDTLKDSPQIAEMIDKLSEQLGVVSASQGDLSEACLSVSFDVKSFKITDLEELRVFLHTVVGGDFEGSRLKLFFDSL